MNKLTTMEDKIDKILEDINEIKIDVIRNTDSLELHIKRTEILESELKPIKTFYERVMAFFWTLCSIGGVLLGLKELGLLDKIF